MYTKINSRWIVDVNVKGKVIKLTEEYNRREYLHDFRIGNNLLNKNKKASILKEKTGKLNYSNMKIFVQRHH